jgi:hypothetical protein
VASRTHRLGAGRALARVPPRATIAVAERGAAMGSGVAPPSSIWADVRAGVGHWSFAARVRSRWCQPGGSGVTRTTVISRRCPFVAANPPCAVAKLHPHLNAGKNTSIVTVMPRTPCSPVQFDSGDRWELGLRWALSVNAAAVLGFGGGGRRSSGRPIYVVRWRLDVQKRFGYSDRGSLDLRPTCGITRSA